MQTTDRHTEDTETKILKAAEREFLEKGYGGARTTSIAEAAGVTHAMLHYYFRTKDKLFERIVTEKMGLLSEIMLSAIEESDLPLPDKIRQGVERHFDFLMANPDLPRFIVNEIYSRPERIKLMTGELQPTATRVLHNLQTEIDRCAAQGLCLRVDVRMLLVDIVSLNVFLFIATPILQGALGGLFGSREEFFRMRREENVRTILTKLGIE